MTAPTTVDEARAALLERLSQVIANRAKVTWDPHPDGRMRTIDSDYLARDIEAEARAAVLDEARAAVRDTKFPKQYTLDESESAHVTFLLGAQEIQTAILAAIDALREGAGAHGVPGVSRSLALRAEGLDVERLAEAIKATYTGGAYLNWSYYRQAAKSIAAEYARLAKDAER